MNKIYRYILIVIFSVMSVAVSPDVVAQDIDSLAVEVVAVDSLMSERETFIADSIAKERKRLIDAWRAKQRADSIAREDSIARAAYVKPQPIYFQSSFFGPVVYQSYEMLDSVDFMDMKSSGVEQSPLTWINREVYMGYRMRQIKQNYMIHNPSMVKYNMSMLPDPPKEFHAVVDPTKSTLTVDGVVINDAVDKTVPTEEVKRVNWLQSFDASLQFSQAYISPNWYQGGNNNLNMIANAIYNVKLNQAFYPKYMFETTVQYKLGLNSAPDDSLRNYSISEDIFRVNSKFGLKAKKRWYYSVSLDFKTQLFKSYKKNTNDLTAAFMSPAELNLGLGMTYEYTNPKKTITFDASLAPLSYNLKACTNKRLDETGFGIKEGHTTKSQIGSNAECKFIWKLAYNITYTSRLFAFTNYQYLQGDWENTISFDVNRFLSTKVYVHLRYDSSTTHEADASWKDWQLKEILSFGFSYKFSTI